MRSFDSARALSAALFFFFLFCTLSHSEPTHLPTDSQIHSAIEQLKADPNLASERHTKTLKWRDSRTPQPTSPPNWLVDFLYWFAQSLRWLTWIAVAILVTTLTVLIVRRLRALERTQRAQVPEALTHVRDLDIRPQSLPDDIGATALALWNEGEHRAALSLLYRGLLSRLVHVHAVPIHASSTEGDCIHMAEQHLPAQRLAYASQLVQVWQRAVYGARDPEGEQVRCLCLGFDDALGTEPPRSA